MHVIAGAANADDVGCISVVVDQQAVPFRQ
jgi:hypothetical protein